MHFDVSDVVGSRPRWRLVAIGDEDQLLVFRSPIVQDHDSILFSAAANACSEGVSQVLPW
jgi:hypothetical protein